MSEDRESRAESTLLTVVYDSGMDERVMETLEAIGVQGWTKTFGGHGFGGTGYKVNTPIWPGTVNTLQLLLNADMVERATTALRELQASYRRNPGLTLWTQPVTLR